MASALRADLDGDGKTDARTTQKTTQVLSAPTAEKSPAPIKHQQGNDPCSVVGQPAATCTNVTGSTFTATHFWDSGTVNIDCPSAFPYTTGSVSTQTSSKHYTQLVTESGTTGGQTSVSIVDNNVRGHPITYTPTVACSTIQSGGGNGP